MINHCQRWMPIRFLTSFDSYFFLLVYYSYDKDKVKVNHIPESVKTQTTIMMIPERWFLILIEMSKSWWESKKQKIPTTMGIVFFVQNS